MRAYLYVPVFRQHRTFGGRDGARILLRGKS
jgi:hypothetical protein